MVEKEQPIPSVDYIAGFFDGEGCISLSKAKSDRCKTRGYKICSSICLTNTSKEILPLFRRFLEYHNIGYYNFQLRNHKINHKQIYRFEIYNKVEIKKFLILIKDKLIIKNSQAEIMLKYIDSRLSRGKKLHSKEELDMVDNIAILNNKSKLKYPPPTLQQISNQSKYKVGDEIKIENEKVYPSKYMPLVVGEFKLKIISETEDKWRMILI